MESLQELSDIKGLPDHRAGEEQILKSLTRVSAAIDGDEIRSFTLVQCLERVIAHIQALQLTKYVKQKQSGLESSAEKIQNAEVRIDETGTCAAYLTMSCQYNLHHEAFLADNDLLMICFSELIPLAIQTYALAEPCNRCNP